MKHIAIFASGGGSNALKIIEYFKQNPKVSVRVIVCNKAKAGVLNIAEQHDIETLMMARKVNFLNYVLTLEEDYTEFIQKGLTELSEYQQAYRRR